MTAELPTAPRAALPLERPGPAAGAPPAVPDRAALEDIVPLRFAEVLALPDVAPLAAGRPVGEALREIDRADVDAGRGPALDASGAAQNNIEQWVSVYFSSVPRSEATPAGALRPGAAGAATGPAAGRDLSGTVVEGRALGGAQLSALVRAGGLADVEAPRRDSMATPSRMPGERANRGSGSPPSGSPLPAVQDSITIGRVLGSDRSSLPFSTAAPRSEIGLESIRTGVDPPLSTLRSAPLAVAAAMPHSAIDPTHLENVEGARGDLARAPLGGRDWLGRGDRARIDATAEHRFGVGRAVRESTDRTPSAGPFERAASPAPLDAASIDRLLSAGGEARSTSSAVRSLEGRDRRDGAGSIARARAATSALGAPATLVSGLGNGAKALGATLQGATSTGSPGPSPELASMLGERLIALASRGEQRARLALHPAELGAVDVHIKLRDDTAAISISVQHPHARELIEASLPRLREMFAGQGLSLVDVDVSGQRDGGRARADGLDDRVAASAHAWRDRAEPELAAIPTPSRHPTRLIDLLA